MRLTLILFMLLARSVALGQQPFVINHSVCSFNKRVELTTIYGRAPSNEMLEYVNQICATAAIQQNFVLEQSDYVVNAVATIDENNNRLIFYNAAFFNTLPNRTYKIAVLAHEIGHHLNFHAFSKNKSPEDEIAADHFAGNILKRLQLKLNDAKKLLVENCVTQGDMFYPPLSERIRAFVSGYGPVTDARINSGPAAITGSVIIKDSQGNSYPTYRTSKLIWLAKNLNITPPSGASYNYDDDPENSKTYGKLFDYDNAIKVCSTLGSGWRLPTVLEFKRLLLDNQIGFVELGGFSETNSGPIDNPMLKFEKGNLQKFHIQYGGWAAIFWGGQAYKGIETEFAYWTNEKESTTLKNMVVLADNKVSIISGFTWGYRLSCRCVLELPKAK